MEPIANRKISLLAFDLDGTLLDNSRSLSDLTLEKIHSVMEKGVKVTISSGRISLMQEAFVSLLGFKGPYIASNGALIINSEDNSLLYSQPISDDIINRICAFAREAALHLCLQTREAMFYTQGNPKLTLLKQYDSVAVKHGYPKVPMQFLQGDYRNFDNCPTYKVLIYAPEEGKYNQLVQYLSREPELVYTFSDKNLFEISPKGIDKGMGIQRVADFYGISLREVCAFGDYDNDIPIFEKVGISVAMGNASANLKAKAMYITDTNQNDGVVKAIEAMSGCFS